MQRRTPLGVVPAVGAQQPTPCGCSCLHRTDSYEHFPIACIHSKDCSNSSLRSQFPPAQDSRGWDVPFSAVSVPLCNVSDFLLCVLLLLALLVLQVVLLQVHLPGEQGSFFILLQLLFCQGKGMAMLSYPEASQAPIPQHRRQTLCPGEGAKEGKGAVPH